MAAMAVMCKMKALTMKKYSLVLFFVFSNLNACIAPDRTDDEIVIDCIVNRDYEGVRYWVNKKNKTGGLDYSDMKRYTRHAKSLIPEYKSAEPCVEPGKRCSVQLSDRTASCAYGLVATIASVFSILMIYHDKTGIYDDELYNPHTSPIAGLSLSMSIACAGTFGLLSCLYGCLGKEMFVDKNESAMAIYGLLKQIKKETKKQDADLLA
jgi:hypothetical protein